ncbi:MAG: ABC transporter ATP-binding protein [Acuticoccus sp.]
MPQWQPRTGAEPLLSVRGLTVGFAGRSGVTPAVRGVDFDVMANEVLCIVGESGSGKSVTALAINGLLPPTARMSGTIRLGDTRIDTADENTLRDVRGREIGMVFQDPATTLNPLMSVGAQVTEGEVVRGALAARDAPARAVALLEEVEIANAAGRADQYPHEFSGGMRQRAVIAMAMAGKPRLIIADEPTTALDVTVQAQVLALLARRQAETGAAVILITHDLGVVAEVADRVAVMYAGRIVESGPVGEIFANPRHPYTTALLESIPRVDAADRRLDPIPGQPPLPGAFPSGCAFHPRCALGKGRARCAADDPALRAVGDSFAACHFAEETTPPRLPADPRRTPAGAETAAPLLSVENLEVHFPIRKGLLKRTVGHVHAVDGVSLVVHPGETVSLVGESGCGKTTTARAVMGLVKATGGRILFEGEDITGKSAGALRAVRQRMQYVFQDPFSALNPVLPVEEIVAEPLRIHGLYDAVGGQARIAELFDLVGLSKTMFGRYPREFSGGQKQRIGIARALGLSPRLLILDEPVAALDVSIQAQILNLLEDLQHELGLAYLFIAHNLSVVRHISDRVAVMYLGRIVEESAKDALYGGALHPYTQSLLSAVPIPDPVGRDERQRIPLRGEIPNPAAPPPGCSFHPRCLRASGICRRDDPRKARYRDTGAQVACHHAGPLDEPAGEMAAGALQ